MSELPAGWEWARFNDVACVASNLVNPSDAPSEIHIAPNNIEAHTGRLISYKTVAADGVRSPKHRFYPGQILYSKIRPYLAKVVLAPASGGLCSADIYPVQSYVEVRFLRWWMLSESFTEQTSSHQARSVLPKINSDALSRLHVPIAPLAEQRKIADQVDAHLSRLDVGLRALSDCNDRTTSLMSGIPRRSGRPNDHESMSSRSWMTLGQLADVVGGVTKDSAKQSDPALPLIPYLRVANVQRGYLDLKNVAEIRVPMANAEKLLLQPGDVLLNEGGDRDKLGRGWVWEGQIERCIHQNHVFRARIRDDILHPKLLAWHANSFGHWFEANGKQSVNLASISLSTIKQLPVPVPPRDEQDAIVRQIEDRLAETARLRGAIADAKSKATQLRRAVLADAFAGRLVPQDPNDEPASVLLERIRTERAASSPERPRSRRPAARTRASTASGDPSPG